MSQLIAVLLPTNSVTRTLGCFKVQNFLISNFHIELKLTYGPNSMLIFFQELLSPASFPQGRPKFAHAEEGRLTWAKISNSS